VIVVLTDLRRPEYLRATLAAADAAGAASQARAVVADAPDGLVGHELAGWPVVYAPKPAGAWRTVNKWSTWAAFELALGRGEDLVFLEDDVMPCARALEYAAALEVPPDCAWVSLYAPWGDGKIPFGIWRFPAVRFTYCQALKIPLRTLRALVAARGEMERAPVGGSDESMALIGRARRWHYGTHYPSLFQHVGERSSVSELQHHPEQRVSRAWPGPGFDAMELKRVWPLAFE
jgi:hypothetical protein